MKVTKLQALLKKHLSEKIVNFVVEFDEITIEIDGKNLTSLASVLKDVPFEFDTLIDISGIDYLTFGKDEWESKKASSKGFSRARDNDKHTHCWNKPRFGLAYHLLSTVNNQRLRIKTYFGEKSLKVDSVYGIWNAADWFEREIFDLFGIFFEGHPDLRRILTDYDFVGHPLRKDFPLSGNVEIRYDAEKEKIVYEAVDIKERITVPKVCRKANRSQSCSLEEADG